MKCLLPALLTLSANVPLQEQPQETRLEAFLEASRERWIAVRHDLHRHPEVSGQEKRTSGILAKALEELGLDVRRGVGGHGVVAILEGSGPGRTLAFRADMDAVRSNQRDPAPYRSLTPGVRHICGHDVHSTIGLALAETLHHLRDEWSGRVVFFFQPAEETGRGAKAMIQEGALEPAPPEECYAYHTSQLPVGSIGVTPGRALAMRDRIQWSASGSGDQRAALRHIQEALPLLNTLEDPGNAPSQTEGFLVARSAPVAGGQSPGSLQMNVSLTVSDDSMRARVGELLPQLAADHGVADVTLEWEWTRALLAGVYNDPALVEACAPRLQELLGPENYRVSHGVPVPFSEDFGSFQEQAHGTMYWLGVSNPELGTVGAPHSPGYVADDGAIEVGVRCMAWLFLDRLAVELD